VIKRPEPKMSQPNPDASPGRDVFHRCVRGQIAHFPKVFRFPVADIAPPVRSVPWAQPRERQRGVDDLVKLENGEIPRKKKRRRRRKTRRHTRVAVALQKATSGRYMSIQAAMFSTRSNRALA
jgi:hypothetical protein